jgi:hypothetical protein
MRRLILPALIVKAPHAAAMVQGLPLLSGGKSYKSVEIRGSRCRTDYRGAVAIFCSNAYGSEVEQHYVWFGSWSEQSHKARNVRVTPAQDMHYRAWCQYTHAWKYRLLGFVSLVDCVDGRGLAFDGKAMRALHVGATDFRSDWSDPDRPNIYLKVKPLAERQIADGPRFDQSCYGCTVQQPAHNPTACHVNWQTVSLAESDIPPHVQEEIRPWPTQK